MVVIPVMVLVAVVILVMVVMVLVPPAMLPVVMVSITVVIAVTIPVAVPVPIAIALRGTSPAPVAGRGYTSIRRARRNAVMPINILHPPFHATNLALIVGLTVALPARVITVKTALIAC